jgi:hypothetical protein
MEPIPRKMLYLVPLLTLIKDSVDEKHPTEMISYSLKQRASATAAALEKYKFYVQRFCEGTVQEWINVRRAMEESWTQNQVTSAGDRTAIVRGILCGESLTTFNATLEELKNSMDEDRDSIEVVIGNDEVLEGIEAIA